MLRSIILALSLAAAAPALAQLQDLPPPATTTTVASTTPAKTKKICHTTETLGSRLNAVKQCATAEEWERIYRDQRETLERQQHIGYKGPGG